MLILIELNILNIPLWVPIISEVRSSENNIE